MTPDSRPLRRVALLPWGNTIEDWVDPLGIPVETLVREATHGSWFAAWSEALRRAGTDRTVIAVSRSRNTPRRLHNASLDAPVCLLPETTTAALTRCCAAVFRKVPGDHRNPFTPFGDYLATPVRALAAAIRKEDCDAILCHEYEYSRFDIAVAIGRSLGIPVFGAFAGSDRPARRLEVPIRRVSMRSASGFVVGSVREERRIRACYDVDPERIVRLGHPIDTQWWQSEEKVAARAELGWDPDARIVVWHGRVEIATKGLDILLEAWRGLEGSSRGKPFQLALLGTGADARELRQRLGHPTTSHVSWRDEFTHDRSLIRKTLSAADLFVMSSRREGLPIAPLEAMSCGLPVVATASSRAEDYLQTLDGRTAGEIVPPEAPALADAISRLLSDAEARQTKGVLARQIVVSRNDAQTVGNRLRTFMEQRAGARKP